MIIVDIDECANGSAGCSHFCRNTIGSFRCVCPAGTFIGSDGKTCEGCSIDNGGCQQICVTAPGGETYHCLCHGNYEITYGKRCKASGPRPYLLIANNIDIRKLNFDGTGYKLIKKSLWRAKALDFHYKKGKVYYVTQPLSTTLLYEMDLTNYSSRVIFLDENYLKDPYHIAIDWANDRIYWTEGGLHGIMRVDLDGSNPKEIVKGINPRGIAVEPYLQ